MKTLQIDCKKAKELFKTASSEFKEMLIDTFGKDYFVENVTDKIRTFEDACIALGKNPECFDETCDSVDEINYRKLKIIAQALNQGWTPDWNNSNQKKWFPWFNAGSGFGFSHSYCSYSNAGTDIGSRLCFKTEELATYAGRQFVDLYRGFLM